MSSLTPANIIWRTSKTANGGKMSTVVSVSGVMGNEFEKVQNSDRVAGATFYSKRHIHLSTGVGNPVFANGIIYMTGAGSADDRYMIALGTNTDTAGELALDKRWYSVGLLTGDVSAGGQNVSIVTRSGSDNAFREGDKVRLTNADNTFEYNTISTEPTYSGDLCSFVLANPVSRDFLEGAKVASCIELETITASVTDFSVSSTAGSYNLEANPILLTGDATVAEYWTGAFNGTTSFLLTGDTLGGIGSGNISSALQPNNAAYSRPYFKLASAGWSGSFQSGDSFSFRTSPAAIPLWLKRVVPANAGSAATSDCYVMIEGEGTV